MQQNNRRDTLWDRIHGPWDVLIIGGGIVGAGLLREVAKAGLRVLLVEAHDFASGTSSRSSKLVHGGLRYLNNGQIKLTWDSVRERQRLLSEGRGLVNPLEFLLVNYRGDHPSAWLFGVGLGIYDVLALKWQHERKSADEVEALLPAVRRDNLVGGYRFYDAQADDARLVLRVLQEGVRAGGTALNYTRVEGLLRNGRGQVCGVQLRDVAGKRESEVLATVVINATGAWADDLRAQIGRCPRLRRLRGSHLIFTREKLPISRAISFLHPDDGRPVSITPWEGVSIIGTTDLDHDNGVETDPRISAEEAQYLAGALDSLTPGLALNLSDVLSTQAGIRSVLDTGKANPSKESRDEVLWDEDGLVTITGGKLTMYRHMAQSTLAFIHPRLLVIPRLSGRASALDELDGEEFVDLAEQHQLEPASKVRLLGRFGHFALDVLKGAQAGDLQPVGNTPTLWAELRWAAAAEDVIHLDDLLLRRTRLGLLLPNGALGQMDRIRSVCQTGLGWDDVRWQAEADAYSDLWQRAYSPPGATDDTRI